MDAALVRPFHDSVITSIDKDFEFIEVPVLPFAKHQELNVTVQHS